MNEERGGHDWGRHVNDITSRGQDKTFRSVSQLSMCLTNPNLSAYLPTYLPVYRPSLQLSEQARKKAGTSTQSSCGSSSSGSSGSILRLPSESVEAGRAFFLSAMKECVSVGLSVCIAVLVCYCISLQSCSRSLPASQPACLPACSVCPEIPLALVAKGFYACTHPLSFFLSLSLPLHTLLGIVCRDARV